MYYYIVDPQKISQKEFERVQNVLYSSLSEYRIAGEVVRITGLRSIAQLVENAFAHEAKTIIAVGNDETLHDVINALNKREMVVGYIPLADSPLADTLGIKDITHAAKTIAFRRILEVDLGVVNGYYFLSKLDFGFGDTSFELKFTADGNYQATQEVVAGSIVNNQLTTGLLDLFLLSQISRWKSLWHQLTSRGSKAVTQASSVLHLKKIEIRLPLGLALKIGERVVAKIPATVEVVPKALKIIVGRDRKF